MANRNRREALLGAEEETFDVLAEVLTSEQWTELLRAPLERAARQGDRGLAQKLVRAGAAVGKALHAAAWNGHEEIVNDLLENGASVAAKNPGFHGFTALHCAAREGETEIVQLLLLKGADKDVLDDKECTPLYLAAFHGHVTAALALLAAGADLSRPCGQLQESLVHAAAYGGHVDIVRAAIEHGADVDAVDWNQETALHVATIFNKTEAIDVLVKAGANIEAPDGGGYTSLHYAAHQLNLAALLALLRHGARINVQNTNLQTPLHVAAAKAGTQGAAEVVDSMLRSGADETIVDRDGAAAADIVGEDVEAEDQLGEDVDRVRQLLANAPADRAWRRRGYLVVCRAHPDRVQLAVQEEDNSACAGVAQRNQSRAKLVRTDGSSMVDGRTGGDWPRLVARVLGLQEEGIFRTIVGHL